MFNSNLKYIKKELNRYADKNPQELLSDCINEKLQATLERYNKEIELNSDYLLTRSSAKVLKALTKLQKRADKDDLEFAAKEGEDIDA